MRFTEADKQAARDRNATLIRERKEREVANKIAKIVRNVAAPFITDAVGVKDIEAAALEVATPEDHAEAKAMRNDVDSVEPIDINKDFVTEYKRYHDDIGQRSKDMTEWSSDYELLVAAVRKYKGKSVAELVFMSVRREEKRKESLASRFPYRSPSYGFKGKSKGYR